MKNIYKAIITITLIVVVGIAVIFFLKIDPYISAEIQANGNKGKKNICVLAGQISPNSWAKFIKTRIFGYDVLEIQITNLQKEVDFLKKRLEVANKI
tara:strand:+ start:412 stop:702 length:291 start_codon:yes stop_codon:yes gene_type:complete